MSASAEMPYFIKPSINLSATEKELAYQKSADEIQAVLVDEAYLLTKMVTINCILKSNFPYYYWVGFYLVRDGKLKVGPYQGTLGCIDIEFGRGVCGKAAQTGETQIVLNTHALVQGAEHIACDPNSKSEIVVPVFDNKQDLIAVFDVDSTLEASFDEVDQLYLEKILGEQFGNSNLDI